MTISISPTRNTGPNVSVLTAWKDPIFDLVPGYKSVNQVFPLRWAVDFKIVVSNIWYILRTRKPTQPLHY